MPRAAVTVESVSITASSAVAAVTVFVRSPTAKATEVGGVPDSIDSDSVTVTVTDSVASLSRLTVNVAAVPSVTGLVPAAIVTAGPRPFTVTATESSWNSPPASVTLSLNVNAASVVSPLGAVNVAVAVAALLSVTAGPAVFVHA